MKAYEVLDAVAVQVHRCRVNPCPVSKIKVDILVPSTCEPFCNAQETFLS